MSQFIIVSFHSNANEKPKWVKNHSWQPFIAFKKSLTHPSHVFFESLTSHQPYFNHEDKLAEFIQLIDKKYKQFKNHLKEIYILENEFTNKKAEALQQSFINLGYKDLNISFYNPTENLSTRFSGSPFFFQIGDADNKGNYFVTTFISMKQKYDNNLNVLNRRFKEININESTLKKQGIVINNQTAIELLMPVTQPDDLFSVIKNFFENMTWINWLLTKHIFKESSDEFNLLTELKTKIQEIKTSFETLQNEYTHILLPNIQNKLKGSNNRLELITNYFKNPSDELFDKIEKYQKPNIASQGIPKDILDDVQRHHQKLTEIKNKLEETITPKRTKLIEYVKDYLAKNRKSVHDDKIKVMEILLEHLQDPDNFNKKNALLDAIKTKPYWANHFFKSRTLEAVQQAQELIEATNQGKEILQPKASITS